MATVGSAGSVLAPGSRSNSTPGAPASVSAGDVLLMLLLTGRNPALTPTAPPSWAHITGSPWSMTSHAGDPYAVRLSAMLKVATGSDSYATTHTAADTEGVVLRLTSASGTITVTPTSTDSPTANNAGATAVAPSITPTANNSVCVAMYACWDGFGSVSPPAGTTPTYTEYANNASGVFYAAAGTLATAGATGTKSVATAQPANRPWLAVHIVVDDGGGGGGGSPVGAGLTSSLRLGRLRLVRRWERPADDEPILSRRGRRRREEYLKAIAGRAA